MLCLFKTQDCFYKLIDVFSVFFQNVSERCTTNFLHAFVELSHESTFQAGTNRAQL